MLKLQQKKSLLQLQEAYRDGNEEKIKSAWEAFQEELQNGILEEVNSLSDKDIVAKRRGRKLTEAETKFYNGMIESSKSSNPKQAFADLINTDGAMPESIIEDVFRDLKNEHPLLKKINFKTVKYLTKWLLSDGTTNKAVWGDINAEIVTQIEKSFKNVDLTQGKLSAFILVSKDMFDLGPVWLDQYVREVLKEALALGLEYGIVKGKGVAGEPIGMIKNISKGVSVDTTNGYPDKTAIEVTNFGPAAYGDLCSKLATTEAGNKRNFSSVTLIVNLNEYLKKVMPATTVMNSSAKYENNVFPFPTETIVSNYVDDNKAILGLPSEYFFGIGNSKNGTIEYDDSYKFLEDVRTYKTKLYGAGQAVDNTVFILLDISKLEPSILTVITKSAETPSGQVG